MSDDAFKPAASLTGALLAKKGVAAPAVRRNSHVENVATELAYNFTPDRAMPLVDENGLPEVPPEPTQDAKPKPKLTLKQGGAAVKTKANGARKSKKKVAMTVRLDPDRHRKLKLLSLHTERSAQKLLVEALDDLVQKHGADAVKMACAYAQKIS